MTQDMWSKEHQSVEACLTEAVNHCRPFAQEGKPASYIPALANANASDLGICLMGCDGRIVHAGQWEKPFTMQSVSKVISFILACVCQGISRVMEMVDVEPTGDAFNSIIRLESSQPGKPFNPMINAGAISISSMLPGRRPEDKVESLLQFYESLTGKRPRINEEVFSSEWETANRNRAIAHYLKDTGYLQTEVEEALEVYLKQCSIEVNTADLARIGIILSRDGYDPIQRKALFSKQIAKISKALMLTCGMYNASGKMAAFIGIPAKSGVSGGILATVPPRVGKNASFPFSDGCGIGIFAPAIDQAGNSVAGIKLLEWVANEWDLSVF
ncbi:glutaminase [Brevibacillus panacihumi]|uniref:glutaminase n=1 Tax=Brevibacillus panacihumi TaxID=497735 RepID=UPI003D1DC1DC